MPLSMGTPMQGHIYPYGDTEVFYASPWRQCYWYPWGRSSFMDTNPAASLKSFKESVPNTHYMTLGTSIHVDVKLEAVGVSQLTSMGIPVHPHAFKHGLAQVYSLIWSVWMRPRTAFPLPLKCRILFTGHSNTCSYAFHTIHSNLTKSLEHRVY